jgi:hypothetical protein
MTAFLPTLVENQKTMYRITLLLLFLVSIHGWAQTGSEIFLFDLKLKKTGMEISNGRNVTQHPGYDNQPSFHSDEPLMYFSSFNEEGRSDIKSFNYKTGETVSITNTPEREYSPTLTPDKTSLSCIIQRDNNAQDLGKYPVDGGPAEIVIDNLVVGYHAWADNSHVALFVLGSPNTLHYLRLPTREDTILTDNIGRSLHKVPGQRAISFVHKLTDTQWVIKKFNTESMTVSVVANTLPGREDIAWTPDGRIISSDGAKLFFLDPAEKKWIEIEVTKGSTPLKGITRLAVNADGDKLAVVVSE